MGPGKGRGQSWASQGEFSGSPLDSSGTRRDESPGLMSYSCCQEWRQAPKFNKGGNSVQAKVALQTQVPRALGR